MGGRKRRQLETTSSLRSTSLRRDSNSTTKTTPKYTQQVKIGCMSGIFQFVSKYHTRHKFLTFGKKQEREATSRKPRDSASCQSHNHKTLSTQVTLEVPRSPAIPAEIRRRTTISPPSSPPKEVTRVTCLDEEATTTEVAAEKRRKLLLGALEKCDEDLQALKRIIKAVRDVQSPSVTPPPRRGGCSGGEGKELEEVETETETESDEPSPVSVLDHHRVVSRSPNISCIQRTREVLKNELKCQEQPTRQQTSTKKAGEEDNTRMLHFQKEPYTPSIVVGTAKAALAKTLLSPTSSRWSNETREAVIEVCRDVEYGLRLEVETFGFLLQHFIFRDLLDEFINELEVPNEAYKRKLSF